MIAFSPPLFSSTHGRSLEDALMQAHNYIYGGRTESTSESLLHFPSAAEVNGNPTMMIKKLNHNASERDRRKKINGLYSSLRSLLPASDRSKKLSIPSTVSRVVKYIPEIQQEVERLIKKKEELLSKISTQGDIIHQENQRNCMVNESPLSAVSATRFSDKEIGVQISTFKVHGSLISEVLLNLEEDELLVINASSFESFGGRVFYNLHLQVAGTQRVECELLREKLLLLCEKRREASPSNLVSNNLINGGFL